MPKIRPECGSGKGSYCPPEADAYYFVAESVKKRRQLIAGKLHNGKTSCAIGSYFDDHPYWALPSNVVDEVAAYNDSIKGTPYQRWRAVNKWLKFKLDVLRGKKK